MVGDNAASSCLFLESIHPPDSRLSTRSRLVNMVSYFAARTISYSEYTGHRAYRLPSPTPDNSCLTMTIRLCLVLVHQWGCVWFVDHTALPAPFRVEMGR